MLVSTLFKKVIFQIVLTLKHAKKIKTHEYARVVKSLPHTKSRKKLSPHPTKCMVCVVCCETFVKIFFYFLFLGEVAEERVESNFIHLHFSK
jgi:hypothetical protein